MDLVCGAVPVWYPHGFPSSKQMRHQQENHWEEDKDVANCRSSNTTADADAKGVVEGLASRPTKEEAWVPLQEFWLFADIWYSKQKNIFILVYWFEAWSQLLAWLD